ncbi:hypothetical protein Pla22_03500 [Rubripirellula amarantea]|uniref:Uncharacterized protein n=1 Tax=Rubripirellula amarantea TaxID=2527999 RepID=A0A5C5WPE4_9BACT|nr:hypothetical protein [Rubripirellula amarantea]TWT52724.1 hypothetical protein Pla22_03500 [Rubripirellula amarantea]
MNLSLLTDLCGIPFLVIVCVLGLGLTAVACYLTFKAKHIQLISFFLPLCLLPFFAGIAITAMDAFTSVGMQLDGRSSFVIEPGLMLQMMLVPLLISSIASMIPAMIAMLGRFSLAWQDSGITLFPPAQKPEKSGGYESTMQQDADDYLERLVRPR